ncbi:MAG: hypothetical protein ACJ77B_07620 [Chloroflexota bacterium]
MHSRYPLPRRAVLVALVGLVVVACGSSGATFDPSSPCTSDGRQAGAYPALEAVIPKTLDGRGPNTLDSGRNCTDAALGTLRSHGVTEARFAGGLWERGKSSGATLAIFESPQQLTAAWLGEFYEAGARTGRHTENIETKPVTIDGQAGYRLDTLNDDSFQTVIVWPRGGRVAVVLVGSSVREVTTRAEHDSVVNAALAAWSNG